MPLLANPAYAGIHHETKLGLIYRNQYNSLPLSYSTFGFTFDYYSQALHGGVGLQVVKDAQADGILQNQNAAVSYNYQNALTKKIAFSFGMEFMMHFNSLNTSKIVVYDMLNQQNGSIYQSLQMAEPSSIPSSKVFADFNAGTVIFNNNFYAGIGFLHLSKPDDGWVSLHIIPMLFSFQTGYLFRPKTLRKKDDTWYYSPNLYFTHQQNMHEINFTNLVGLGNFQTGIGIRNSTNMDALIFHIGFLTDNFRIGYSFDLNIATTYFTPRNAHEISIQYLIKNKRKTSAENDWGKNETNHNLKRIKCPNFFR